MVGFWHVNANWIYNAEVIKYRYTLRKHDLTLVTSFWFLNIFSKSAIGSVWPKQDLLFIWDTMRINNRRLILHRSSLNSLLAIIIIIIINNKSRWQHRFSWLSHAIRLDDPSLQVGIQNCIQYPHEADVRMYIFAGRPTQVYPCEWNQKKVCPYFFSSTSHVLFDLFVRWEVHDKVCWSTVGQRIQMRRHGLDSTQKNQFFFVTNAFP